MNHRLLAALFLGTAGLNASAQRASAAISLSPRPIASSPLLPYLPPAVISAAAAPKPVVHESPTVIDGLREHGAQAAKLADLQGEAGAGALEQNFMSAASLDGGAEPVSVDESQPDQSPILARMLERVRLDDRGRLDERHALKSAFARLLKTPTGRRYADQFLADGVAAQVHFDDFPDSRLILLNGRKTFHAVQAITDWRKEGYADIRLNRHYVDGDPRYLRESLPSILGHELLGHGLWYARAAKENLHHAFHFHELNEMLARLVGWAIDYELDGRFEERGVWTYLSDPARYLKNLKMRHPSYANALAQAEMATPLATLRSRLAAAEREVEFARRNLAAQRTWPLIVEYFISEGVPARRFHLLREELTGLETYRRGELTNAETVARAVSTMLDKLENEPERVSARYLAESASHPFFERLRGEVSRLGEAVDRMAAAPSLSPPRAATRRPADQLTFEDLVKMYEVDKAADAHRAVKHWNN